jgi:outer membrane protein assembly factor BamB
MKSFIRSHKNHLVSFLLMVSISSCGMSGSISIASRFKRGDIADWPNLGGSGARDNYRNLDFNPPELVWRRSVSSAVGSVIAVSDSIIYLGTLDGRVYALGLRKGDVIGTLKFLNPSMAGISIKHHTAIIGLSNGKQTLIGYDVFDSRYKYIKEIGAIETNPLICEDYVYLASQNGKFYSINLSDGLILWSFDTPRPVRSSPVVSGTSIFFGCDDGNVYALNRFNGNVLWKFQTAQAVFAAPAIDEATLYVGSTDSTFYAINLKDGNLKWKYKIASDAPGKFFSSAAVDRNKVVVGGSDGVVYAFNKMTGALIWKFQTGGAISTAPVILKNHVLIGSQDKNLYAIDASNGEAKWSFEAKGRIKTNIAVYGDYLVWASENKYVYVFKMKTGR